MQKKPHLVSSEKQRAWVFQLGREYDQICFTFKLPLRRPVLAVEPLGARWGQWDPETRTLSLCESLILNHRWDVILEVLKHEMAHQIVSEIHGGDSAHGELFRQVARGLGMAPWAVKAETETLPPDWGSLQRGSALPEPETAGQRLLKRAEKLLSLASSDNEHEALAAMQKVRELYEKYHLDRIQDQREGDWIYFILRFGKRRLERHVYAICSLLSDHFLVRVIHSREYDAQDLCEYKVAEILGTRENVLMAEYVFHFLQNQLEVLWKRFKQDHGAASSAKQAYLLGVLSGFREKLERQAAERESTRDSPGLALVEQGDAELEGFVATRYPRLQNTRRGRNHYDASAYNAGKDEGKKLTLHKPVRQSAAYEGLLLPRRKK